MSENWESASKGKESEVRAKKKEGEREMGGEGDWSSVKRGIETKRVFVVIDGQWQIGKSERPREMKVKKAKNTNEQINTILTLPILWDESVCMQMLVSACDRRECVRVGGLVNLWVSVSGCVCVRVSKCDYVSEIVTHSVKLVVQSFCPKSKQNKI